MSNQPGQAGWHPDPNGSDELRYLDAAVGTDHTAEAGTPAPDGPASHPVGARQRSAVVALVLGVIALVAGLVPVVGFFVALPVGIAGVIMGLIARARAGRSGLRGRTMALVAVVLSVLGILAAIVWIYLYNRALDNTFEALYGTASTPAPAVTVIDGYGTAANPAAPGDAVRLSNGLSITLAAPEAVPVSAMGPRYANSGIERAFATTVTFASAEQPFSTLDPLVDPTTASEVNCFEVEEPFPDGYVTIPAGGSVAYDLTIGCGGIGAPGDDMVDVAISWAYGSQPVHFRVDMSAR